MSDQERDYVARVGGHFFVHATDCGHSVWTSEAASSGIRWCVPCQRYVGVIITRKDHPLEPGGEA